MTAPNRRFLRCDPWTGCLSAVVVLVLMFELPACTTYHVRYEDGGSDRSTGSAGGANAGGGVFGTGGDRLGTGGAHAGSGGALGTGGDHLGMGGGAATGGASGAGGSPMGGAGGGSGVGGASAAGGAPGAGGKVGIGGMGMGGSGIGGKGMGGSGAGGSGMGGSGAGGAAVDPCFNNGGCAVTATCMRNVNGSRTCACNPGYSGDGITCADVNECLSSNGGCDANATCTNTIGSRTCACKAGFTGSDGVICFDVNECLSNNGGCSVNASCTNTVGGRTCTCAVGYTGNGTTCTLIPPPAPISTWKFERQSTPTQMLDSSGANNGTLVSMSFLPPVTATMPIFAADRKGVANGAIHLDLATNDNWVFVPNSSSVNTPWVNNAITVTIWVRMSSVPASGGVVLFDRGETTDTTGFTIDLFNGNPEAIVANHLAQSAAPMPVGFWTFMAATYDGTDLVLYQNGVVVSTFPGVGIPLANGVADLTIGAGINKAGGYATGFPSGDVDEVRLYGAALSAPQINAIMQE